MFFLWFNRLNLKKQTNKDKKTNNKKTIKYIREEAKKIGLTLKKFI